jgi:hypothetical protein
VRSVRGTDEQVPAVQEAGRVDEGVQGGGVAKSK